MEDNTIKSPIKKPPHNRQDILKRGFAPTHPGEILREDYIKERGLAVTQIAKGLGVACENLSAIVNGRAGKVQSMP